MKEISSLPLPEPCPCSYDCCYPLQTKPVLPEARPKGKGLYLLVMGRLVLSAHLHVMHQGTATWLLRAHVRIEASSFAQGLLSALCKEKDFSTHRGICPLVAQSGRSGLCCVIVQWKHKADSDSALSLVGLVQVFIDLRCICGVWYTASNPNLGINIILSFCFGSPLHTLCPCELCVVPYWGTMGSCCHHSNVTELELHLEAAPLYYLKESWASNPLVFTSFASYKCSEV